MEIPRFAHPKSLMTFSMTGDQLPGVDWRNNPAVGYQGESLRLRSQRHSEETGRRIDTGLPRAPARWARAVSTVTI